MSTTASVKHQVLVTGFGPFRQFKENPSWLAVRTLQNTILHTPTSTSEAIRISTLQIPTVYSQVLDIIPGLHAAPPVLPAPSSISIPIPEDFPPPPENGYTLIIHVGVAPPTELRVELFGDKTGYNKLDHEEKYADVVGEEEGKEEDGSPVLIRGVAGERYSMFAERLKVEVDVDQLLEDCARDGKTLVTSTDAGHYLCDFTLYCSLAESKMAGRNTPVMFIHCSPVNEPMSTEQVAEGLKSIVANVCARLG
ncbi:hypothetical protein VKT23_001487 [Stygiomarasmius scandens]|uniref:Peptidase C15, pyroglutamyl peptidase I-like protein n=1 Tax=Marasmiellus scandens TaxID=2682957 RepID=A0ABR1K1P9_9AGAR